MTDQAPNSLPPIVPNSLPGTGLVDPFAGQRELSISAPPPTASGGPIPSVYRSQLDAPMRVKIPLPIVMAILIHAAILAAALLIPKFFGSKVPLRKPIIAHIVIQGKERDKKFMPRKDPPPAAPPPSAGPVIPAVTPPSPAVAKPAPEPKPVEPHAKQPSRQELMERALAQATKHVDQQEHKVKPEEREGSPTGSQDGNSTTEDDGDQYFAQVQAAIVANYTVPSIISERERMGISATVDAWISRDGTITRYVFEKRSGNHFFDDALELALKRTKVPPPPADRAGAVLKDGVALVFTP